MKLFVPVLVALFSTAFVNVSAQSYVVTLFGDTVACDSVDNGNCLVGGKPAEGFSKKEFKMSRSNGVTHVYENGFDRGQIIMESDSMYLTLFQFKTMRHKKEHVNSHVFFVDKKTLTVKHEYLDWYLEKGQTIIKYFPINKEECPNYAMAMENYEKACQRGTTPPVAEGRAVVREWNKCYPMK